MASSRVFGLYLGRAETTVTQGRRSSELAFRGSDFSSGGAGKQKWRYRTSDICEREWQSLFTCPPVSAGTACLSPQRAQVNTPGQRRTGREQMLLAACVSHSNLANFPAEIRVRVSHVFSSLTSLFSRIPAKEGVVGMSEEEEGVDGGGWQRDPWLSCTSSNGAKSSHPPSAGTALVACACARRDTRPLWRPRSLKSYLISLYSK